ncbi:MAG TPA: patatin-like phospholipase family protein, partial [Candidatus Ratteibacteria bacterium]|nr:patatin-like phospholipase family protein [Candidatus Ratteibacteria bacterium]
MKIGLALGGGGARSLSQIGVIKVFEREGIEFDIITGVSMGSVVGSLYSFTKDSKQLEEYFKSFINLTKKQNKSLVEHNPNIDKIHVLEDSGLLQLIEILRQEKYDHIIDLHHNIRTTLIKFNLFRPSHSFAKLNFQKWLMVNFKKGGPCAHIVDRYLETCSHLG